MWNDNSFDNNRLSLVDTIAVDDNSRLTITRHLKKLINILPKDLLIIYQDKYNKDLVIRIQRDSRIIDSISIKRCNPIWNKSEYWKKNKSDTNISHNFDSSKNYETIRNSSILLVDDDEELINTFKILLNSEGYYNIRTFTDSTKALKYFLEIKNSSSFFLLILDIRMPGINGIQLYHILKILGINPSVLFLTALNAPSEMVNSSGLESQHILLKPIEPVKLIEIVNETIFKMNNQRIKE